jgi:hypothetical protein
MQHPLSAKVGTTSPTSGGSSVGIVGSWTKATEFSLLNITVSISDPIALNDRMIGEFEVISWNLYGGTE